MEIGTVLALVISAIGLVVSILTFIYSRSNDKFYRKIEEDRRNEEIEKKNRVKYNTRPQFKTIAFKNNLKKIGYEKNNKYDIDVFVLPYKSLDVDESNYTPLYEQEKKKKESRKRQKNSIGFNNVVVQGRNTMKRPICQYIDVYNKKDEWISYKFLLKNVGKSNIVSFYLLSELEKFGSMIYSSNKEYCNNIMAYKSCQFVCRPKRNRVDKNDDIRINISFHKNYVPTGFESGFLLKMRTEDNLCWEQCLSFTLNDDLNSREISHENYYAYLRGEYLDAIMYDRVYWSKKA